MKATLKLERETKGALLYKNVVDNQSITTLYIRKSELKKPYPKQITMTIALEE